MSKKLIVIIIILLSISFAGMIFFQFSLLNELEDTRKYNFRSRASNSIQSAVYRIESINQSKHIKQQKYIIRLLQKELKHTQDKVFRPQNFSYSEKIEINMGSRRAKYLSKIEALSSKELDDTSKKQDSSNNLVADTLQKIKDEINLKNEYFIDPLSDRGIHFIHKILVEELNKNNIDRPFELAIQNENEIVNKTQDFKDHHRKPCYSSNLILNDDEVPLSLLVQFRKNRSEAAFFSLRQVNLTVIGLIGIAFVFTFALFLIYRQKQINDIRNDFVNNMTHELKTPISSISLASQMLHDESVTKTPKTLKYVSGIINDETKRLSFQVEKVLQMAAFEKGGSRLNLKEHDVNDLIENVINNFQIKIENKNGELFKELNATNSLAQIDEAHFSNIVFNLLDNALKYRKGSPVIKIKTQNVKDNIKISIIDNGIGIPKKQLKRIFDKFYRIPTGNLHNAKGFGLGLAYVKNVVDQHGGNIKAHSVVNVGTTFDITIPSNKIKIKNERKS